jgi:hypothetical protein
MRNPNNSMYTDMRKEYIDEWRIWYKMIYSCEHNKDYYVEIEVCEDWQGESGFLNWFDHIGPRPSPEYVHDRINKFGDYEPGNVEWTTKAQSMNNCRKHIDPKERAYWGKIAQQNGIKKNTYYARVWDRGWEPQDAATLPPSQKPYKFRKT